MPIRKVKGGFRWGSRGKVYKSRKKAVRQMRAAFASGYKGESLGELVDEGRYALRESKPTSR